MRESFISSLKVDPKTELETKRKILGLDKRFQAKTFKNINNQERLIVHMRENIYGARKVVQAQFKTLGCNMKKAGSCWNCNYGVVDKCLITPRQYIASFSQQLEKVEGDVLVLEALGSITDPREFDQEVLKKIIEIAIKKAKFRTILIETHVSQIPEELVKYIYEINQGKKDIGFEVGIEDMNPEHRKLINKLGVQNSKLQEVYDMLDKYGISLDINLIYGFPFMSEKERVEAVISSIKNISQNLPKADIALFLMSVKENTIMEYMKRKGFYTPANPWGLVEVTRRVLEDEDIDNIVTFSWFGEKVDPYIHEDTCYTCNCCKEKIIEFFRNINGTFNQSERKALLEKLLHEANTSDCMCYQKFKQKLQEDDSKNPSMRYKEFIEKIGEIIERE